MKEINQLTDQEIKRKVAPVMSLEKKKEFQDPSVFTFSFILASVGKDLSVLKA